MLPDVFGHVAEHRRDHAGQALQHQSHHGLAAAAAEGVSRTDVETILGNVEVDIGEIHHAEVLQGLEEAIELEALKIAADVLQNLGGALQHPAIQQR